MTGRNLWSSKGLSGRLGIDADGPLGELLWALPSTDQCPRALDRLSVRLPTDHFL